MSNLRGREGISGSLYWDLTANEGQAVPKVTERDVPYFFLSYARESGPREVADFYQSLCTELVQYDISRQPAQKQGFMDTTGIGLGQRWPETLITALSTCKVMLALCSMPYFGSEPCGKEFQLFADRLREYEDEDPTGPQPALLLPVMWVPLKEYEMPPAVKRLQFHTERLGDTYQRYGLRQLVRVDALRSDYHRFVFELASIIREVTRAHDLPDLLSPPSFDEVTSAFHRTTVDVHSPTDLSVRDMGTTETVDVPGRRDVHFVVAAPSRQEIQDVREELEFYGDWSIDWAPYRPNHTIALARYASQIASEMHFTAEVATVAGLTEQVRRAVETNQMVVLLVDRWAVRLDKYEQVLIDCETEHADHTAVMVPASATDQESRHYQDDLTTKVNEVFRASDGVGIDYWPDVRTLPMFGTTLGELLELTANHLISTGEVHRTAPGDESDDPPTLDSP